MRRYRLINKFRFKHFCCVRTMDSKTETLYNSEIYNISFDSDDEDGTFPPWFALIRNLTKSQMESLHVIFQERNFRQKLCKDETGYGLNKEEFVNAIDEVYGNKKYSYQSVLLFEDIDKDGRNEIRWEIFIDFLIDNFTIPSSKKLTLDLGEVFPAPHVKRETIIKIVHLETENYFCYAIVTKYGHVGVYDGNLNFLTSYNAVLTLEDVKAELRKRRKNRWITDAVFCADLQLFVLSNSCRNVLVYEASGLKHEPLWFIVSVPNAIYCLHYTPIQKDGTCIVFMGDDHGHILSLTFLQPKTGLLKRKQNDKLSVFYWVELSDQKEHVRIKNHGKIHNDIVRQIRYFPENESLISCSNDASSGIVNKHMMNRRKRYVFKIKRGVNYFDHSERLKMLITGSNDGVIRLWDPILPSQTLAVFSTHEDGIVDLKIVEDGELLVSCSRDACVKLWDLKDFVGLQTLKIDFPVFHVLGKVVEWGTNTIYPGAKQISCETSPEMYRENQLSGRSVWKRPNILITCCNYIAKIRCTFYEDDIMQSDLERSVLPPPPLQNSVLVPNSWNMRANDGTDNFNTPTTETEVDVEDDEKLEKYMESLKFILERDIVNEFGLRNDTHYKIATLETKKLKMKGAVSRGAPYLALDLFDIEELSLSPHLPVPNKPSDIKLVQKIQRMLSDANSKDLIFSEPSSSRSKSSRSSAVDLNGR